jgi:hypothetical protein
MKSLTIFGCVCALLSLVWFSIGFALLAMTIGVVSLLKGRVENGLAVIVLAGACGFYGVSHNVMPTDDLWDAMKLGTLMHQPTQPDTTASATDWRVISLQTRVTATDSAPVCTWKLQVRNDSLHPAVFHGAIEFQDAHGATVSQDRVEGMQVQAGAVAVFTGSVAVNGGKKIARAVPQIENPS